MEPPDWETERNVLAQELSPVSKAELMEVAHPGTHSSDAGEAPLWPHAVTLDSLQTADLAASRPAAGAWRYILSGGAPPRALGEPGASALLVTGHRDGRARMWDASCEVCTRA